jgi:hypothetical protein
MSQQFGNKKRAPWKGYYKWYRENYGTGHNMHNRRLHGLGDYDSDDSFDITDPSSAFYDPSAASVDPNADPNAQFSIGDFTASDGTAGSGPNYSAYLQQAAQGIQGIASAFNNVTGTATPPAPGSYAGTQAGAAPAGASTSSQFIAWVEANPIPVAIGGIGLLLVLSSGGGRR